MRKRLLPIIFCLLLSASCGQTSTMSTLKKSTPIPTFPLIGEWEDITPYKLTGDYFVLVLDMQQINANTNVVSMTSIYGECVYAGIDQNWQSIYKAQAVTYIGSGIDTINGVDITLEVTVEYYKETVYDMTFVGHLNADGTIFLASSQINGVQDYLFTQTVGAVVTAQNAVQQDTCSTT